MKEIDFMEVGGFKVGQAEDPEGITGITVMLMDKQSPTGLDIRGGGPASRDMLRPVHSRVQRQQILPGQRM